MTENKRFRECLIEFDEAKQKLEKEKGTFEFDVIKFMRDKGIIVKVLFFGNTFGLDIDINWEIVGKGLCKIPLEVLSDFCKEFGCEFEYTNCDGGRYIFSFNGLNMDY